ncbi:hypothetical protein A3A55_00760 [Candidatus Roizmanbacteria bacterium RIFCSPLOWO2_01_FULL_40_14]|nr:MAG: hypothetical protein UU14_C0005G0067 [Candidatus Roizmanbacteria bacterium GW2011_GWB1_40_7]OGK50458.1 MAG: hypothetical protein A3A55_00760 [Candidatus Roizmanbacteria bacterium RIFCSPLOWO2_01_FULL_40_14]
METQQSVTPQQTDPVQPTEPSHHKPLKLILIIIGILLGSAILVFEYQSINQPNNVETWPTPVPQESISPTPEVSYLLNSWTYMNDSIGFSMQIPERYELIKETEDMVSFGFSPNPNDKPIPYLTITTTDLTEYDELVNCQDDSAKSPCLTSPYQGQEGSVEFVDLGGKNAASFYLHYGADSDFHTVQTTEDPRIELEMNVAGGGLDQTFDQILSTFRFLDEEIGQCTYEGKTYQYEERFPAGDGCNTCFCDKYGSEYGISCTEIACNIAQ